MTAMGKTRKSRKGETIMRTRTWDSMKHVTFEISRLAKWTMALVGGAILYNGHIYAQTEPKVDIGNESSIFLNSTYGGGDWKTFGNGPSHTGYYNASLGTNTFVADWSISYTNTLQQVATGDGRVFACLGYYFTALYVQALDVQSGAFLWQHDFASGHSLNPPTFDNGKVFVQRGNHATDTQLWCLDAANGLTIWSAPHYAQWENYYAPTVVGDGIWINGGSYGGMYGFSTNAVQRFFVSLPQYDEWTPTYYQGSVYSWVAGTFTAHNPNTGTNLWSVTVPYNWFGWSMNTVSAIDQGRAFIISNPDLHAIHIASRTNTWTTTGQFKGSPAVANNVVYAMLGGDVRAYAADTGTLFGSYSSNDSTIREQPIVLNDALIVGAATNTFVINLSTRALRQTLPHGGKISYANGRLYIAGANNLLATYVLSGNTPPVAEDDEYATPPNTPLVVSAPGVLANDTDSEGATLYARQLTNPNHGSLTLERNGRFRYVPSINFTGVDQFLYVCSDGLNASTGTVVIATQSPPTAPSGLVATANENNVVSLAWTDNSNDETGFAVERAMASGGPWSEIATVAQNITGYSDGSLTCGVWYYYRVRAYKGPSHSAYSNVASARPYTCLPGAPVALDATVVSASQIDLMWIDDSFNENGFSVERSLSALGPWVEIASVGTGITTFSDTGLDPQMKYYYRVRSFNNLGYSGYSNTDNATTPASPPSAPTNLVAVAGNTIGSINLTWTDNSSDESQFNIERSLSAGGPFVLVATVGSNVTTYTNAFLAACTTYHYRIRAYNAAGYSGYSNITNAKTTGCDPTPPVGPSGVAARAIADDKITLSWADNDPEEAGYQVSRSTSSSGPWRNVATVGANAISWTDSGLNGSTQYFYRVRAFNAAGKSSWRGPVGAKTQKPGTPDAPSNLVALVVSSSQVDLAWADNSNDETGFKIYRRVQGGLWALLDTVGANVTAYSDNSVSGGTVYEYRVKARNSFGNSQTTNVASVTP
jgi:hypothetical protein